MSSQLCANGEKAFLKGEYKHAVQSWKQAIPQLDKEKDVYLHTLLYLTNTYQATGYYQKAMSSLNTASAKIKDMNNPYWNAILYSNFGDLFLALGNTEKAEEILEHGAEAAQLADNTVALAIIFNNLGNVFAADQDLPLALEKYIRSLELIQKSPEKYALTTLL
ncbi:MAG: tetratricopeptide repeat protein [Desulfobacteraceae bacterium]|nr:tetratricopeptide repeat protein [Desulfobacteraceae bacterium]